MIFCDLNTSLAYYLSTLAPGFLSWRMRVRARDMKASKSVANTGKIQTPTPGQDSGHTKVE